MNFETIFFIIFVLCIIGILLLDLLVIGKNKDVLSFREAIGWNIVWITLSLLFCVFLLIRGEIIHGIFNFDDLQRIAKEYTPYLTLYPDDYEKSLSLFRKTLAINYLSAYLIEETLSIDNIFVIYIILSSFSVPEKHYKPVLFWGILGAIILRCIFIFVGSALVHQFEWILYIFGVIILYSGVRFMFKKDHDTKIDTKNHKVVKFLSRFFNIYPKFEGKRFFVRQNKIVYITPLFIVLVIIEFTDLIFAMDSIPAIFAISKDPYIIFFSNIFAIIGLRSLFFLLVKIINLFKYLQYGISILLIFIGIKLLLNEWLNKVGFNPVYSLYFILFVLVMSILISVIDKRKPVKKEK